MRKITSESLADTHEVAREFLDTLEKNSEGATVVCLEGELGSGKTTFVKEIADLLGVDSNVTSPTFVIEKKYETKNTDYKNLYHIDAYRLKGGDELISLDWAEKVENKDNIIFIEWPSLVSSALPKHTSTLSFTFIDETTRTIEIE